VSTEPNQKEKIRCLYWDANPYSSFPKSTAVTR